MREPTTQERINALANAVTDARLALADAIREACPGLHVYVQRRDGLPAWCKACRYTDGGQQVDQLKAAEMGACSDG